VVNNQIGEIEMDKNTDTKIEIRDAILVFRNKSLFDAGIGLFNTLGYDTSLQAPLDNKTYEEYKENYINVSEAKDRFNEEKALTSEWKSVDILFQLTDESFNGQQGLFESHLEKNEHNSYLCIAIELSGNEYTKSQISTITREINKLYSLQTIIIFKYGENITMSLINRRINKKDTNRDVLEKVTLIKDIVISRPHRAHIEILFDMSLEQLKTQYEVYNFETLHKAWSEVLDTQALNKRFYTELSNWYFWAIKTVVYPGYEMEAARNSLLPKEEKVREHNAKNLIRLLTRLLFVWFIKEKDLIPEELFDEKHIKEIIEGFEPEKRYSFKDITPEAKSIYYKAILQNLFFASLNTEHGKRAFRIDGQNQNATSLMRYQRYHKNAEAFVKLIESKVPFMNGGLFECLDHQDEEKKGPKGGAIVIYEDGFSDRKDNELFVPDYIFFGKDIKADLSTEYDDKKKKDVPVTGLINILQKYKFTIAENTPVEEDIALDPELLGRVFENLLASYNPETKTNARKQTGSFYTPRPIVEYMVDESLKAYLKTKIKDAALAKTTDIREKADKLAELEKTLDEKLNNLISYNDCEPNFTEPERKEILRYLDECRILDPACGSGAFPMGILQKMVYVIHKLDPNNDNWKLLQIEKITQSNELTSKEKNDLIAEITSVFDDNELDYGRKLYLIENCIHGIDIQPIATQISRLRFFISLIVDQKVDSSKENFGVRPLPNLENSFVTANSLIGLDEQQSYLSTKEMDALLKKLQTVRHDLFKAKTPKHKFELRQEDKDIRKQLENELISVGFGKENARLLSTWDPYDKNRSAEFFDAEWMFGIKNGFDIVIGNPPYVESRNESFSEDLKDKLEDNLLRIYGAVYKDYFPRGADLLIFFYELSLRLINTSGINCFITQNSWLSSDYGEKFQNYISQNTNIKAIIDSDFKYFEGANINTVITLFQGNQAGEKVSYLRSHESLENKNLQQMLKEKDPTKCDVRIFNIGDNLLKNYKWGLLFFTDSIFIDLLIRASKKGSVLDLSNGFTIGQGVNSSKSHFSTKATSKNVPLFTKENGAPLYWKDVVMYVDKSEISKDRKIPVLFMPRGVGSRYYCTFNSVKGYSASYVDIYSEENNKDNILRVWLFCNSTFGWLLREASGRKNLGGGMLKAEATDLKYFPLLYKFSDIKKIENLLQKSKDFDTNGDITKAVNNPLHKEIDQIVYDYLGFTQTEQNYIKDKLINDVLLRNDKSKKAGKC
jgi:hypothetical protein